MTGWRGLWVLWAEFMTLAWGAGLGRWLVVGGPVSDVFVYAISVMPLVAGAHWLGQRRGREELRKEMLALTRQ